MCPSDHRTPKPKTQKSFVAQLKEEFHTFSFLFLPSPLSVSNIQVQIRVFKAKEDSLCCAFGASFEKPNHDMFSLKFKGFIGHLWSVRAMYPSDYRSRASVKLPETTSGAAFLWSSSILKHTAYHGTITMLCNASSRGRQPFIIVPIYFCFTQEGGRFYIHLISVQCTMAQCNPVAAFNDVFHISHKSWHATRSPS